MAKGKGKPLTRKDVKRLIEENGGTAAKLDLSGKMFEDKVDLSDLDLSGIILSDARLFRANFNGSELDGAIMQRTRLEYAIFNPLKSKNASLQAVDLRNAYLQNAEFKEADLTAAQFQKSELEATPVVGTPTPVKLFLLLPAYLENTDFRSSNLRLTNFEGCFFYGTKLEGACIRGAGIFEAHLEDADWGSYIIWEESKKEELYFAENIYRRLKLWYQKHGMYDIAAKFYYREKEANRKALKLHSKHWNDRLAAESMRALFGYGERWWNIILWIAVVIFGLAAAYYFWGSFSSSSFWDTLYYSATSFSALGYGQWAPQPTGWAKGMGAAEAFIGISMMALLLVTFFRKWTR